MSLRNIRVNTDFHVFENFAKMAMLSILSMIFGGEGNKNHGPTGLDIRVLGALR